METLINLEQEKELEQDVSSIVSQAKNILVETDEDLINATNFTKNIKTTSKKIKDFFEPIKTSAYSTWKGITGKESEIIKPLEEAEKIIKSKMVNFLNIKAEEARKKEAEVRKQQEEERQKALETATTDKDVEQIIQQENIDKSIVIEAEKPKIEGMSAKIDYEISIIDEQKVPNYINGICIRQIDTSMIKKLAIQSKGLIQIEGVSIKETKNISIKI